MEQTNVGQLVAEQAEKHHKKVIVMFERSTGDVILVDASEDGTFFKGATVNTQYTVVAFIVPVADLEGKGGRPSKIRSMNKAGGVAGFFKRYLLTQV